MANGFVSIGGQETPSPHPALRTLDIMVGKWDMQGRDFTTNEVVSGQSNFNWQVTLSVSMADWYPDTVEEI